MIQLSIKGNGAFCIESWKWSMTYILPIYNPQASYETLYLSIPVNPLRDRAPMKRLRTPPENPQTHLALMLMDVSRINDVKRVFYRFITVFIAASQPRSDPEMLCKVSLQVVSLPWSVSFSHIRNEQKNMDWSFSLCLIDSGTTWPPL